MSTLKVPFGGSNVIAEGEGPPRNGSDAQRKSLHNVRIPTQTVAADYQPSWDDKGNVKWVSVPQAEPPAEEQHAEEPASQETAAQPYDVLSKQLADLTQTVQFMAQNQFRGGQPQEPQGPQPPNPEDFDFYDPRQVKEFQQLNNTYIQQMVNQSVQAAMAPHQDTMRSAEYTRQYNNVLAEHGDNPNFKPIMDTALQLIVKSNGKFSIPEAYDFVASSQITSPQQSPALPFSQTSNAKPAQRTITAQEAATKAAQAQSLPPRNGVSGAGEPALPAALMNVGALGRIMLHNQQTGRARFPG